MIIIHKYFNLTKVRLYYNRLKYDSILHVSLQLTNSTLSQESSHKTACKINQFQGGSVAFECDRARVSRQEWHSIAELII